MVGTAAVRPPTGPRTSAWDGSVHRASLLRTLTSARVTELTIKGVLSHQACDDKVCFTPQSVPPTWNVALHQLDRDRGTP